MTFFQTCKSLFSSIRSALRAPAEMVEEQAPLAFVAIDIIVETNMYVGGTLCGLPVISYETAERVLIGDVVMSTVLTEDYVYVGGYELKIGERVDQYVTVREAQYLGFDAYVHTFITFTLNVLGDGTLVLVVMTEKFLDAFGYRTSLGVNTDVYALSAVPNYGSPRSTFEDLNGLSLDDMLARPELDNRVLSTVG